MAEFYFRFVVQAFRDDTGLYPKDDKSEFLLSILLFTLIKFSNADTVLQCELLLASFLQVRQLLLISLSLRNYTIRKVLRTRYQVSWLCSVSTFSPQRYLRTCANNMVLDVLMPILSTYVLSDELLYFCQGEIN